MMMNGNKGLWNPQLTGSCSKPDSKIMEIQNTNNTNTNTTTSTNTTFVDQTPLHVEFAQQQPTLPPAVKAIPDEEWFAAQQLSKPIVVSTLQWDGTQVYNTNLWSAIIPDIVNAIDSLQSRTLRMYAFYRANWVLRFQLNGTKFHQGQLIAAIIPFGQRNPEGTFPGILGGFTSTGLTGFPSVQISASASTPVELKIPFTHIQDYFMTNAGNQVPMAHVRLNVLNQLKFSTGASPQLTLTVSLYAEEPEVHVPIYDHDYVPFPPISLNHEPTGLFSNMGAAIGHLATGNFKGFFNSGSAAQKDMANLFDKPAYLVTAQKTISPVSAMSHGKGTETTIRLGLDPTALSSQPIQSFGNVEDEMSISHIVSTPMLIDQITWTDVQTSGTRLRYWPVSPLLASKDPNPSTEQVWQPTFLSWIATLYTFWKGGIKFRVDAICTNFHTGRLLVAFIPNGFVTSSPTLTQALSCPNVIMDIQSSTQVEFEVPFISQTPYKKVITPTPDLSSITGYLYMYVLNDLVHPDNVAGSIDLNVYVSGSPDFEFFVPRDCDVRIGPAGLPPSPDNSHIPTSLDVRPIQETKTEDVPNKVSLTFGMPSVERPNRFGEEFPLVDLIKRFSRPTGIIDPTQPTLIPVTPRSPFYFTLPDLSPLGALSLIFASWYGSLRYKFVFPASRTLPNNVTFKYTNEVYETSPANVLLGTPFSVTNTAQDCGVEVEVPCYTRYNLLISPPLVSLLDSEAYYSGTLIMNQSADPQLVPDAYVAAGDDFRFYYLVSPPTCFGSFFSSTA